jgi:cobalt-zinc-cadmium efflux system outer membrane protein
MTPRRFVYSSSFSALLMIAVSGCTGTRNTVTANKYVPPAQSTADLTLPPLKSEPSIQLASDTISSAPVQPLDAGKEEEQVIELTSAHGHDGLTIEQFEQLAMSNNPTLSQQAASAQEASGIFSQVGKKANPTMGYFGAQIADRGTDQHGVFLEQEFVTGNKLQLNEQVMRQAVEVQRWNYQSQTYRVMTDVRMRFFEALAAQKRLELIQEFRGVASQGVDLARKRNESLEASKTDVLQANIQLNEVEVQLQQAEFAYNAAWKGLASVVGVPYMQPTKLSGELPTQVSVTNWDQTFENLLQTSPELHAARAKVAQARANLSRQEVQAIPNITGQLGAGYDRGTDNGLINLQISAPLPVFNKNQGNISAAYAAYCKATHEVRRLEMAIQARLAQVAKEYDSARVAVEKYNNQILPQAQETLQLAEQAYNAGEFAFLQVLVVRQTFYQTNLSYIQSLSNLATAQAQVNGLLLTGGLDAVDSVQVDDSLRGQTFSQQ